MHWVIRCAAIRRGRRRAPSSSILIWATNGISLEENVGDEDITTVAYGVLNMKASNRIQLAATLTNYDVHSIL
jgi:hypothetical protein